MSDKRDYTVKLEVITDDFCSGESGVLVYNDDVPIQMLFPVVLTGETPYPFTSELGLKRFGPYVQKELEAWGQIKGAVDEIKGYPLYDVPPEISYPLVMVYGGQELRLFVLMVPSEGISIPCYVPYTEAMKLSDEWVDLQNAYPLNLTQYDRRWSDHAKASKTLH